MKSINDLKLSFASKHVPGELPNSFCFFNNLFPSGTCASFSPVYIKGEIKTRQMCWALIMEDGSQSTSVVKARREVQVTEYYLPHILRN